MKLQSSSLHRYLLKIWYLGNDFFGSQRQPHKRTVEGELIRTLQNLEYLSVDEESNFKTAARTDAGVHAFESAFCFSSLKPLYPTLIDSRLPSDMGLVSWVEVDLNFHPRWEAKDKTYFYIYPLTRTNKEVLDTQIIQDALEMMVGTHDFRMFSKTDVTKPDKLTNLTMKKAELRVDPDKLIFTFKAQSFLWEQIRRSVSFLIQLGKGEANLQDLQVLLESKNHSNPTLHRNKPISSDGLILAQMNFPSNLLFQSSPKFKKRRKSILSERMFLIEQTYGIYSILNEI